MIGEVIVRDRDLQAAIDVVHMVFAGTVSPDAGLELVREVFAECWPHWTEHELVLAMRAALVTEAPSGLCTSRNINGLAGFCVPISVR